MGSLEPAHDISKMEVQAVVKAHNPNLITKVYGHVREAPDCSKPIDLHRLTINKVFAAMAATMCLGTSPTKVRIEMVDGLPVIPVTISGRSTRLVIDTGSPQTELRANRKAEKLVTVEVAGRREQLTPTYRTIPDEYPAEVAGVLGLDFLSRFTVGLNLHDRQMLLWPGTVDCDQAIRSWHGASFARATHMTLAKLPEGTFTCEVKLQEGSFSALLDSGSNGSAIRLGSLVKAGAVRLGRPESASGLGIASAEDSLLISLANLSIGGVDLSPPSDCSVVDWTIHPDMLLGTDVLEHARVVFDFKRRQMCLQGSETFQPSPDPVSGGAMLFSGVWLNLAVGSEVYFNDQWPLEVLIVSHRAALDSRTTKDGWFVYALQKADNKPTDDKAIGEVKTEFGKQSLYDGGLVIIGKDSSTPAAISLSNGYSQSRRAGIGGSMIFQMSRSSMQGSQQSATVQGSFR